jgi:hypothetical protein
MGDELIRVEKENLLAEKIRWQELQRQESQKSRVIANRGKNVDVPMTYSWKEKEEYPSSEAIYSSGFSSFMTAGMSSYTDSDYMKKYNQEYQFTESRPPNKSPPGWYEREMKSILPPKEKEKKRKVVINHLEKPKRKFSLDE